MAKKHTAGPDIRKLNITQPSQDDVLAKAYLILRHSHETANTLHVAFKLLRKSREGSRGALTDEEQDLWRSMIVMAASGLDAVIKQLIRDTIRELCKVHNDVRSELEKFVKRQLLANPKKEDWLASVLIAETPKNQIIESYIKFLTGDSLQSVGQLQKAKNAMGLDLTIPEDMKKIFEARNHIIHELDVDFSAHRRNRRIRQTTIYKKMVNDLLKITEQFYAATKNKLQESK